MLLPADPHPAREPVRGGGDRVPGIAAAERERVRDQRAAGQGRLGIEHGRQLLVLDHGQAHRAPSLLARARGHGEDRLAGILDEVDGQQRLVVAMRGADVVLARHVGGGQHADHTLGRADVIEIDPAQPRMRLLAQAELDMEQALGLGQVVDVEGLAGDVAEGAVVRQRLVDGTLDPVRHGRARGRPPAGWRWQARWSRRRGA